MTLKHIKSKSNPLAELHFVFSLSLEESVMLIGNIGDETHKILLTEVNGDEYNFNIEYIPGGSTRARIKGRIQRWNGTETKIDANTSGYNSIPVDKKTSGLTYFLLCVAGISVIAEFISMFLFRNEWLTLYSILIAIGCMILLYILPQMSTKPEVIEDLTAKEARQYIFQMVIDAFKSAGDVEAI